jgi:hypothetical protein
MDWPNPAKHNAYEVTGECCLSVGGESKTLNFGSRALAHCGQAQADRLPLELSAYFLWRTQESSNTVLA